MAFVDDSDVAPKLPTPRPAAAPGRGKLVPILLVTLNLGVVALLVLFLGSKLGLKVGGNTEPVSDISALDPKLLVTSSGGRLSPVMFGNLVFEVTRIAYASDVRSRTVTITVPGQPPESALFRVGDTFAGGRIRVVEILRTGVILESGGKQQTFGLLGATPDENAAMPSPSGLTLMPARSTADVPDVPAGQIRPATDPRAQPDQVTKEDRPNESGDEKLESIDQLPDFFVPLERAKFRELQLTLADVLDRDFVLAPALDQKTKTPVGLEIKNLKPECPAALRDLRVGDVIMYFNGEDIRRVEDLDLAILSTKSVEEICIEFRRGEEQLALVIQPGVPDEGTPEKAPDEPPRPRRG